MFNIFFTLTRILEDSLNGGGERDRTDDLVLAKHALSQLSYTPLQRTKVHSSGGPGRT